jgi:hypothetical protein
MKVDSGSGVERAPSDIGCADMSISRFSLLAFTLFTVAACGSEGPMGEMGDPGAKGDMGTMGNPGTPGQDGDDGTPGANGTNGAAGSAGLACWDLNGNGMCDVAQEDKGTDGMCTVADCQGPAGATGPTGPAGATAGQGAGTVLGNGLLTLAPNNTAAVPGLSGTVTVPATGSYLALISTHGSAAIANTDPDTFAAVTMFVRIDNAAPAVGGGFQNMAMFNGALGGDRRPDCGRSHGHRQRGQCKRLGLERRDQR